MPVEPPFVLLLTKNAPPTVAVALMLYWAGDAEFFVELVAVGGVGDDVHHLAGLPLADEVVYFNRIAFTILAIFSKVLKH